MEIKRGYVRFRIRDKSGRVCGEARYLRASVYVRTVVYLDSTATRQLSFEQVMLAAYLPWYRAEAPFIRRQLMELFA
ncbi:hypothetical protein [Williamsia sp. CHRR-6]|uniref:hypothetical protein n=1 Tax=Williamsia sp. CHRR-6 TaxID=2835871 RepID=UPI001BDB5E91|nr:hypothetical protein [Williamsia sp. CHRR-6]MBT0567146.1 hypothetical protein [Williamsia sp. CHRR-6]